MIARRRAAFLKLCDLLRTIEADNDDLASVRALNLSLLKEVLRDEAHVLRLRAQIKALNAQLKTERRPKTEATALRAQITRHTQAVDRYVDQLFIWRCIGDALAYAYIGSFNIKHAFFDTASTDPKPSAGQMTGKSGLVHEVGLLLSAIDHRVPAVLCDLTNIIRYGDVCLLGGNDPVPIEVKSSPGLNQRGKRQAAKLAQLEEFLTNDYAAGFRGVPEVRRVAYSVPHRDCISDINLCITSARRDGWNAVCPEQGLVYVAIFHGDPIADILGHLQMSRPLLFQLNVDKREKSWAPYLPFVNSIRAPQDLYDFVVGNLSLIVAVDAAVVCDRLAMPCWTVSLLEHPDQIILLEEIATGGKIAISAQFVGRLGYEFMSLDWFVEHEQVSVMEMWAQMSAGDAAMIDMAAYESAAATFDALPRLYRTDSRTFEENLTEPEKIEAGPASLKIKERPPVKLGVIV